MTHTSLRVDHDRHTHVTRSAASDDRWDRDDTSSSHSVTGMHIVGDDAYFDVTVPDEVLPGEHLWLVWAVYSTGDSFGHDDAYNIEFVSAHRDEDTARHNAGMLGSVPRDASYGHRVKVLLDRRGTTMEYTVPWLGYFESLDYVEVGRFMVSPEKGQRGNRYFPGTRCDAWGASMARLPHAVIHADGTKEWVLDGQSHRSDGPAVMRADGTQEWWINGQLHRSDGPAVMRADGTQMWWINGQLHRSDGPAVILPNGKQEWCVDGKRHRLDGPALIGADGTQMWCVDGQLHRSDGPAVIGADGTQEWCVDGQLHRSDGPAVMRADGNRQWWLHGKNMTEEIESWMKSLGVSWPWDEEIQFRFRLTFS